MKWRRSFWGKHPSFKDYIRIQADEPMIDALIQWIDKWGQSAGGHELHEDRRLWSCFWMTSPNAARLTCGRIGLSRDAAGRSAPVLCTLNGVLPKSARRRWDMLPLYCLGTWQAMADLTGEGFASFTEFKEAFQRISPPDFGGTPPWTGKSGMAAIETAVQDRLTTDKALFIHKKMLSFTLREADGQDSELPGDESGAGFLWIKAIRERIAVMPGSAFLQEADGHRRLYLFYRPLGPADFLEAAFGKINNTATN
ncbi:MAG: hypothetical protein ACQERN_02320 [Thermodesulfobacteriota bacterium]